FEPYGFDIIKMNPDGTVPPPQKGHPTIYVGTQEDVAFSKLRENPIPGRHVVIDEIDEALAYANTTYIISEGVSGPASDHVVEEVKWAHNFLDKHVRDESLTVEHFGLDPDRLVQGKPVLTEAGAAVVEKLLDRPLADTEQHRLEMAATAKWVYVEHTHY